MIYEIKKYGDPVLREKTVEVETVDDNIREILQNMTETMYDKKGVGLAAPQVGISKRMLVLDWSGEGEERSKSCNYSIDRRENRLGRRMFEYSWNI